MIYEPSSEIADKTLELAKLIQKDVSVADDNEKNAAAIAYLSGFAKLMANVVLSREDIRMLDSKTFEMSDILMLAVVQADTAAINRLNEGGTNKCS